MLNSKLWKSMWQIHTTSGSVEEVLGDSLDLIALNFNEGIYTTRNSVICNQSLCNWHATGCRLELSWSRLQL
jgi:hypothetical protein